MPNPTQPSLNRVGIRNSTDYSPFGVELDGRTVSVDGYRFGFQGSEKDNEFKGAGNSYDYGARIYDSRLGRFLSIDGFASKFEGQSTYLISGNTPIMGIDINGDSLYILTYTVGNTRGDEMFKNAALTREYDIKNSGYFNPKTDKVVLIKITDMANVKNKVESAISKYSTTYGKTIEFGIWSHAGLDGPIGTVSTSSNALEGEQMTLYGWSKTNYNWDQNSRAFFYGCQTGVDPGENKKSFSSNISGLPNFKNVTVYGQTSSAFPSIYTNYRDDKERGDDHSLYLLDKIVLNTSKNIVIGPPFIPQLIDQTQSTFKVQKTYMVGGYRILNDLNQNKQNVALPIRRSINGWGKIGTFQTGNTKP